MKLTKKQIRKIVKKNLLIEQEEKMDTSTQ